MDEGDSRNEVNGAREKASAGGTEGEERRHHPRYNKAQARHRYRKGKS